ncbi:sulfite exporter TauE/SafE family protein [Lachnospiraceae bacterium KM106-2]|nr:sulfite exporter TauE/SafE family protein [Lachnospiraceae bacterium KM106-2]
MTWMIIAVLCAYFIKGLCGFANTLVFTSILSFGINNVTISPMELILGYPSNLIMAWKGRKALDLKVCIPLAILVITGSVPGIFLLKNMETQVVKIFFGFVVVLIGLEMLLREYQSNQSKESKVILMVIGIFSGVLCGLYGVGALLAAYVSRVTRSNESFKSNICVVFCVENSFRILLYLATGILQLQMVIQAITLMPLMMIGLWLGMNGCRFLDEKLVKKIVILMLILSGIALIITNL